MRVIHYQKAFAKLTETFIYDYIVELENQGIVNYVVANKHVEESDQPFNKMIKMNYPSRWNPERLLRRSIHKFSDKNSSASSWPQIRRNFKKVVLEVKPDVIHAHYGPHGVAIAPVAQQLNIPLVTSFYGYDISKLIQEKFWRDQYLNLVKKNCHLTVLSEQMKSTLLSLGVGSEKISIIHLSRNITEFEFQKPFSVPQNFISVGRLTHKKGHFDTIKAIKKVREMGYEVKLRIIGGGPLEGDLEKYIKDIGIESAVELLGPLPNYQVIKAMSKADAFILCSKTGPDGDMEGTPTVLVEAQALGLPCISTSHAGIPEMIPSKNRFLLAEEGNVEKVVEKIIALIQCPIKELNDIADEGRAKVENEFNLTKEVRKLIDTYKSLQT